jgi:ABC-type uncharacterized transport system substrate-binding protein
MIRREFITLLGGAAAAWPLAARAQQPAKLPTIGYLGASTPSFDSHRVGAFVQRLRERGWIEGRTVTIEYRWSEGRTESYPEIAAEFVRLKVDVIVSVAEDPVKLGLVASFARPGGNLTGINFFTMELAAKRLELLRELVPAAVRVAVLVNPADVANTETTLRDVEAAAHAMGLQIQIFNASTSREIDAAFATLVREKPDALFVGGDTFFTSRRVQLTHLASRHAIPATYASREDAEAGGLMSYGTSLMDAYRQVGIYAGRILKGTTPADLPVVQASKFELVINLPTARALGLEVPPTLLGRADEVIE